MADAVGLEAEIRDLDRFFLPSDGSAALAPGMTGQACANLRHALSMLGYNSTFGDSYDQETLEVVRQFQADNGHVHRDGHCGEGTRRLLIRVLLKSNARGFFKRAQGPEDRSLGHVFLSYARKDLKLVQDCQDLISGWGFTPWRDQSSIPGGADWNEEIRSQIEGAYLLLAFVTRHFAKSEMCKSEIEFAMTHGKPVLALQYASIPEKHWLQPVLQSKQWITKAPRDVRSPRATEFRGQLRHSIREAQRRYRSAKQL